MSCPRVALANSTYSCRSNLRPTPNRFVAKLSSRKSPSTCTVSLASVYTNGLCINISSLPSTSAPLTTNLIPFPSSPTDFADTSISQPDRTCLDLLRSSPDAPSQPRVRASPVVGITQERRKRSTARLLQPVTPFKASDCSSKSEPACQPPRKRPRLHKNAKGPSVYSSSDLRFLALVQRNVAGGILKRRAEGGLRSGEGTEQLAILETQDWLLASRLRTHLLARECKEKDVVDLDREVSVQDSVMDVDSDEDHMPLVSIDMDVDIETRPNHSCSSASFRTPHQRSLSPLPLPDSPSPSSAHLIASLILRNKARRNFSSTPSSERRGVTFERTRRSSPLAIVTCG